ncbi:Coiled-coil domain-containing protein 33, partial [Rhizoclosmatium hyalinum]
ESYNLNLMERNDFEKKYLELQQAHMGQQNLLQRLQKDQDSLKDTKETLKKQERIITKLGSYLKDRLPSNLQGKVNDVLMSKEPEDVEVNLHKILAEENAQLKKRIMELESRKDVVGESEDTPVPRGSVPQDQYYKALMRAETNETRIIALEQELTNNAREFARKLADMQKQLIAKELSKPLPNLGTLKGVRKDSPVE